IDLIRSYFCALVLLTSLLATLLVVGLLGYFAVGPVSPLLAILAAGFVGYWVGRAIWPGWPRTKGPEITWIGEVMERPAVSGVRSEGGPDESGVLSSGLDHLDREWPL
ncbi:MAG TPA: hypothetical protein VFT74_05985, partial [Isosphaeraceae bacterium]|nr:hypothetical protein [Isosphaeraceae bacterium]